MKGRLIREDGRESEVEHLPFERTLVVVEGSRRRVFRRRGWLYGINAAGDAIAVGAKFEEQSSLSGLAASRGAPPPPSPAYPG